MLIIYHLIVKTAPLESLYYLTMCVLVYAAALLLPVTLLGAHSLGHVHVDNSGFGFKVEVNGPENLANNSWDSTPLVLDNKYYVDTINKVRNSTTCRARR
jgi:hypothetical protein